MKVKSFMAPTMQEALKMIREDLGPEASILSSESVSGGIEIVAALNYEEATVRAEIESARRSLLSDAETKPAARLTQAELAKEKADGHRKLLAAKARVKKRLGESSARESSLAGSAEAVSDLQQMKEEINRLREIVTTRSDQPSMTLVQAKIAERLESCHIAHSLRELLLPSIVSEPDQTSAWRHIQRQLLSQVDISSRRVIDQREIVALVGSSGSGKTTTAGKMAAQMVAEHGTDSVALITTDQYRVAAAEQLKVYGRILQVPVYALRQTDTLDELLGELGHKKLVIIDTPGLVPSDKDWNRHIDLLSNSDYQIDVNVVISVNDQYEKMNRVLEQYQVLGKLGCIATKFDEAVSLGEVMSVLVKQDVSLRYTSHGTHIMSDLASANHLDLWSQMEKLAGLIQYREVSLNKKRDIDHKNQYDMSLASQSA